MVFCGACMLSERDRVEGGGQGTAATGGALIISRLCIVRSAYRCGCHLVIAAQKVGPGATRGIGGRPGIMTVVATSSDNLTTLDATLLSRQ
jgi:hypothetical protein